jgi:hypothetical protein
MVHSWRCYAGYREVEFPNIPEDFVQLVRLSRVVGEEIAGGVGGI